jgi:hypothetical protein
LAGAPLPRSCGARRTPHPAAAPRCSYAFGDNGASFRELAWKTPILYGREARKRQTHRIAIAARGAHRVRHRPAHLGPHRRLELQRRPAVHLMQRCVRRIAAPAGPQLTAVRGWASSQTATILCMQTEPRTSSALLEGTALYSQTARVSTMLRLCPRMSCVFRSVLRACQRFSYTYGRGRTLIRRRHFCPYRDAPNEREQIQSRIRNERIH